MHELLNSFLDIRNSITALQTECLSKDNLNVVELDLMFVGATNRTGSLMDGFKLMVENENYFCAIAIMRMQIDCILRMYAFKLVKDPNEIAHQVRLGAKLSSFRANTGEKLTDAYLCEKYSQEISDVKTLYELCSGYIHLSGRHTDAAMTGYDLEHGTVNIMIGRDITTFSESDVSEMIMDYLRLTRQFVSLMQNWYKSKASQFKAFADGSLYPVTPDELK